MYAEFFQLSHRPFSATPDPDCCYLSAPTLAQILSDVVCCIEGEQGISVITGEPGVGKSLLCQYLAEELKHRFLVAHISTCQFPTSRSLLQAVLFELGQPYQGKTDQELRLELIASLKSSVDESEGVLLILDEAHLLSTRLLEEIRILSDLSHAGHPMLRIVLAGQPGLDERLTSPACSALNQRIAVQSSIPTLTRQETMDYIDFRTRLAGQPATEIFSLEALLLIAQASDGLPRCINQLCDHSLMLAYVEQAGRVEVEIVRMALEDLQQLPLHWNPSAMSLGPLETYKSSHSPSEIELESDDSDPLLLEPPSTEEEEEEPGATFEFGADFDEEIGIEPSAIETSVEEQDLPSPPTISLPHARIDSPAASARQPATQPVSPVSQKKPQEQLPAEERIFDRYAILDAGRSPTEPSPLPPTPSQSIRQPSPPSKLRGPMSSAFFEHSAIVPPYSGEGSFSSDPLEFLDEVVMPLIEHAEHDELPTRSELDRRLGQFIAAQRAAVQRKPRQTLIDHEEEIGEEALDLCLEVQEALGNTVELNSLNLGVVEIDSVDLAEMNPEQSTNESRNPNGQNIAGSSQISTSETSHFKLPDNLILRADRGEAELPPPKYQFVFSELRKRLRKDQPRGRSTH